MENLNNKYEVLNEVHLKLAELCVGGGWTPSLRDIIQRVEKEMVLTQLEINKRES
jgi:hypothetical protein